MNDLSEYFSDKDEIIRLNNQANLLAGFYRSFYEAKIKELKNKLNVSRVMTCKYKNKKESLMILKIGTVKALLRMNKKGVINITTAQIAKESFVDVSTVSRAKKELGL